MDRLIKRNGFVWAIRARLPWISFERGNNREDPPSKTEGGAPTALVSVSLEGGLVLSDRLGEEKIDSSWPSITHRPTSLE